MAFLDTLNRTVLQPHIFAVADIPIRAFLEYISCLVVAGSCHIPPLTNPFHTPVVPHHYTTTYPQFKSGTARFEAEASDEELEDRPRYTTLRRRSKCLSCGRNTAKRCGS